MSLFANFLDTLITHDYSARIVGDVLVKSGDIGIGSRSFPKCACLGVSSGGVEFSCQDCGRSPGNYIWSQAGDGAGSYPIIEIRSKSHQLVGALVVFDSILNSPMTLQAQITSGELPTLEDFGFARIKGFGELRSLKLGQLPDANQVLVSDVSKFDEQANGMLKVSLKEEAVSVFAFCEPMGKSDMARTDNSMVTDMPDSPRPRILAILASSLAELVSVSDEYLIEDWSRQVLTWRTSMITTDIPLSSSFPSTPRPTNPASESVTSGGAAFCTQCGAKFLKAGQKFCQSCGAGAI
jgi:hypothetical protein